MTCRLVGAGTVLIRPWRQDDAGPWIRRNFPMLRYIVTIAGQNSYGFAT